MTDFTQFTPPERVTHYRARARHAIDRAAREPQARQHYLDLAKSWNALAEALERELATKPGF
jgi:hypothetical protein